MFTKSIIVQLFSYGPIFYQSAVVLGLGDACASTTLVVQCLFALHNLAHVPFAYVHNSQAFPFPSHRAKNHSRPAGNLGQNDNPPIKSQAFTLQPKFLGIQNEFLPGV